jgi:hypothetical protein
MHNAMHLCSRVLEVPFVVKFAKNDQMPHSCTQAFLGL